MSTGERCGLCQGLLDPATCPWKGAPERQAASGELRMNVNHLKGKLGNPKTGCLGYQQVSENQLMPENHAKNNY